MNKIPISVHPLIKKIIQNLDLDLGAELSRYEKETVENAILIPELMENDSVEVSKSYSNSTLVYTPSIEEEEPIPVASRLISNEDKSLLDLILTPWGVFGIIIFFGTNIFIFLGLNNLNFINENKQIQVVNQPREEETNISEITNQTNEVNNQTVENQPPIREENENNITPPPLPTTLATVENSIDSNNLPPSPYPDLKTALMTEISKNSSLNESSLIPPPPPLMEEITPPILNNNPNNNSNINFNINPNNSNNLSSIPVKKDKYLVMANYENMNQFNNIKQVIPNALITNIGGEMKIQLGVFKTEGEAKSKSQQWQKQGINSFVN